MRRTVQALLIAAPLVGVAPLWAGLPSQQEALGLAFPGAAFTRKEHFLTEAQAKAAQGLAGSALSGLWQVAYEARKEGKLLGVAFFDTHRVRTLNETAMVAVSTEGRILRVEVVAFREPQDYMAREAWVRQFDGKPLNPQLSLKGAIRPLSGCTLTAHALTEASRRGLALFQVLYGGKG
ncbi:MAG: FMN-binding protein [Acidobacteria bacterium]|nr:FMN-binding protein [Acidobacteriota bacterium]